MVTHTPRKHEPKKNDDRLTSFDGVVGMRQTLGSRPFPGKLRHETHREYLANSLRKY